MNEDWHEEKKRLEHTIDGNNRSAEMETAESYTAMK
jgi:hypothetical protein